MIRLSLIFTVLLVCFQSVWAEDLLTRVPAETQYSFSKLDTYAFRPEQDFLTDALLVWRAGSVIYERYANGFNATKPHPLWSASKSVAGALIGIAEYQGLLSREDEFSAAWPSFHSGLRLSHALQMSSGLKWSEVYETNPLASDVIAMLYVHAPNGFLPFLLSRELEHSPGANFRYSSADTNLLMAYLRHAVGHEGYEAFVWGELFEPLGLRSAVWERDASGIYVGSSYLHMTARDLLRFGELYLGKGQFEGRRFFSEDWYNFTVSRAPAFENTELEGFSNRENYGAQFWLNKDNNRKGLPRPYPAAPEDAFFAQGHFGQTLAIIPSLDVLALRFGTDMEGKFDRDIFLKLVIEGLAP